MTARDQFLAMAPRWLRGVIESRPGVVCDDWREYKSEVQTAAGPETAQALTSKTTYSDAHAIMLDIDVPAALVPSSSPGHSHLYIDRLLTTEQLEKLLDVLAECGIIEPGFAHFSKQRGFTTLRLPWIRKGYEKEDAATGGEMSQPLLEWLLAQPGPVSAPF